MLYRVIKRLASVWGGEYLAFGGEDGGKGEEVGETRRWERCKNWSGLERDCDAACSQSKEIGGVDCPVEYTSRAGKSHGKEKDSQYCQTQFEYEQAISYSACPRTRTFL